MAQAETDTTTRRGFVRLATAAGLTAAGYEPAIADTLAAEGDKLLLQLGGKLQLAWQVERSFEGDEQKFESAAARAKAIVAQIEKCQATTLAGMRVKALAVSWCQLGKANMQFNASQTTDVRLAQGLVRDLLALGETAAATDLDPDPIFALIEQHKAADRELQAACREYDALSELLPANRRQSNMEEEVATDDPRWIANQRRQWAAMEAVDEVAVRLLDTPSATAAGLSALLRYGHDYVVAGNAWPDPIDPEVDRRDWISFDTALHRKAAEAVETLSARAGW